MLNRLFFFNIGKERYRGRQNVSCPSSINNTDLQNCQPSDTTRISPKPSKIISSLSCWLGAGEGVHHKVLSLSHPIYKTVSPRTRLRYLPNEARSFPSLSLGWGGGGVEAFITKFLVYHIISDCCMLAVPF